MGAPTGASTGTAAGDVRHVVAELAGVSVACLHDASLLGGLLIAAAGAAGLHPLHAPILRTHAVRGVDAMLLLEGGHASLHAYADRRVLLVDLLAAAPADLARALDVFTRRLAPDGVNAEQLVRLERRSAA